MSNKPTLFVDTYTALLSSSGSVTSVIYWNLEREAFPENAWNDFPVIILQWWLTALDRLHSVATSVEKLHFMDGPFSLEVSITEHGTVRLASINSKPNSKSRIDRGCCGLADMMDAVEAASRAILAWASNAGIHTQELKLLAETLHQRGHYKA